MRSPKSGIPSIAHANVILRVRSEYPVFLEPSGYSARPREGSQMIRGVAGVCAGLIAWFLIATAMNLVLRFSWPGYAASELSFTFSLAMLLARLVLGALSSLCAGFVAAWVIGRHGFAATILGTVLTVLFIPIHFALWEKFPLWYHLIFLGSLLPFTLAGSRLNARSSSA